MEYAIVVGHTQFRPGACSPYSLPCEWEYNRQIAKELECIADVYFYDSYNFGYKEMCKRNANRMNKKDYKLIIELHYNAASPSANGAEALYYFRNQKAKKLCEKFSRLMTKNFGIKNRGAKALVNKYDRGFWAVYFPYAPTILLEPFFGTNQNDVAKMGSNIMPYVDTIKQLIKESKNIL